MTRVIPFTNKNKKITAAAAMFQSMDMQDLGLGSLPDLLFTEQLDVVQQDSNDVATDNLDGDQKALFQDLEDLSSVWETPTTIKEAPPVKEEKKTKSLKRSTSTANILSQALTECNLESFIADNQTFIDQLSPATSSNGSEEEEEIDDDSDRLINEMEEFLAEHELNSTRMDTSEPPQSLTANESKEAEDILDALMAGNICLDENISAGEVEPSTSQAVEAAIAQDDSGYLSNISNISEVVTADGQKVVIIIANDMAAATAEQQNIVKTEPAAAVVESDSDPEWSPDSPVAAATTSRPKRSSNPTWKARKAEEEEEQVKTGRVEKKKRGPYKRSPTYQNIKDKKERKKAQNVEAARRYRDKKKAEAEGVQSEESTLVARNKKLKSKVAEMENEMRTLKKLMLELGLVVQK